MPNADRDTLLALAERVEGLSNPDREVDAVIKEIAGHSWDYAADWGTRGNEKPVAYPYTASLDAAKTLVPKGWHVGMLTECDEDDNPSCCLTQNEEPCRDAVGRGADMALSLVAASLRARAGGL